MKRCSPPLHVHHRTYERVFHETLDDLCVLCEDCHELFHGKDGKDEEEKYLKG